ncbi:MAG: TIGR04282 family arsenosugar biosynthesis glycosyltransferase [Pyrinomonadaceae bacterium]
MKFTIIIMAKVPRAGNVKTRLQPFLSPEQCAALSEAFLEDAINKAQSPTNDLIIAFSPGAERDYFSKFEKNKFSLVAQKGENLGAKMFNAFQFAFAQDSDAAVVMIGADSPTFPTEFIERSFEFLETEADAVLGKSADGGFYLIGLKKLAPRLFDEIRWSLPSVFKEMRRNLKRAGINHVGLLPAHYDVDTPDDLRRLYAEITADKNLQARAPQTFKWLSANEKIFA